MTTLRIATRKSPLAMWQAEWVAERLLHEGHRVELIPLASQGDVDLRPIRGSQSTGLFTKSIQAAVLDERADIAVHSLKDLPTAPTAGLRMAAIPSREDVRDCLVAGEPLGLDDLPHGATIGSGSRRRQAQLLAVRPDLNVQPIRGNVQTRLQKVADGEYHATLLARAGLLRLGMRDLATAPLPLDQMLPAPGQGALGLEVRADHQAAIEALAALNCDATLAAVTAERTCLRILEGGCLAPIAVLGQIEQGSLRVRGRVLAVDGSQMLQAEVTGSADAAETAGEQLAKELLDQGAAALLHEARS